METAAKRVALQAERRSLVRRLESRAQLGSLVKGKSRPWSARELARQTGINRMTWSRFTRGELDLAAWLDKARSAAERLGA